MIPKEWENVKLGDKRYFEIIMGQSPPSSTYNQDQKGLPFYQGNADFGRLSPTARLYCSSPQKIAEAGDILLSVRAPVGEVNIANQKCCIGRGLAAIRPKNKNNLYLFYYLTYIKNTWVRERTTFEAIKRVHIDNKLIAWPPLLEQQKIAEVLSTVDEAIQKVAEAIEKTQKLKQGLMQELLSKIVKTKQKIKLKEILNLSNGERPIFEESGCIPVYGANGVMGYTSKHLVDNEFTLIFGRVGASGEVHLAKGKIWISDNAIYTENYNKEKIYPLFLFYLLRFKNLKSYAAKSTHPIITQTFLNNFQIEIPKKIAEQQKIAEILSTVDQKIELEQKRKSILEKIKSGLMEDLLTGKKRVTTK